MVCVCVFLHIREYGINVWVSHHTASCLRGLSLRGLSLRGLSMRGLSLVCHIDYFQGSPNKGEGTQCSFLYPAVAAKVQ